MLPGCAEPKRCSKRCLCLISFCCTCIFIKLLIVRGWVRNQRDDQVCLVCLYLISLVVLIKLHISNEIIKAVWSPRTIMFVISLVVLVKAHCHELITSIFARPPTLSDPPVLGCHLSGCTSQTTCHELIGFLRAHQPCLVHRHPDVISLVVLVKRPTRRFSQEAVRPQPRRSGTGCATKEMIIVLSTSVSSLWFARSASSIGDDLGSLHLFRAVTRP